MNSVNKTLIGGGYFNGVIHEAAQPGLTDESKKLNGCETGEFRVTLGHNFPAKHVFHTLNLKYKNDYKLNDFYKSCLWKVLAYNVKSFAFCCEAIDIPGSQTKEAAKIGLATVRLWLESNHSSIDHVIFCTFENADYEIYKDLMSNVYFPVSKYHLTNIYMKENSNTDCVVNEKSDEISNELGQIYQDCIFIQTAQNSKSESLAKRSKRISSKIDFNVIRDSNIPLGLINHGENICFFNSVIQVLYSLPVFRGYIYKLRPPVTGVAVKIKKLFSEIETSTL